MATEPETTEPQPQLGNCPECGLLIDRSTGEGVVYGKLPGSGGRGQSHSVTDVMFGRLPN